MPKIIVLVTYFIITVGMVDISPGCSTTFAGDGNQNAAEVHTTKDSGPSSPCHSDTNSKPLVFYLTTVVFITSAGLAVVSVLWQYLFYPLRYNHQVSVYLLLCCGHVSIFLLCAVVLFVWCMCM